MGDPFPVVRSTRAYLVRVTLGAPLPFAFRWCTDYSPEDGRYSGEGYVRRILGRSARKVTFEDLYDTERGWIWIHRVVRLTPPDGWRAESVGSDRALSVEYRLTRLSGHRTRLTIRARRRPYGIGGSNPPKIKWERNVAQNWKRLGRTLEREYRKSRTSQRRRSRPRRALESGRGRGPGLAGAGPPSASEALRSS